MTTTSTGYEGICDNYYFNMYVLQNDSLGQVFNGNTCQFLVSVENCLIMQIADDIHLLIDFSCKGKELVVMQCHDACIA